MDALEAIVRQAAALTPLDADAAAEAEADEEAPPASPVPAPASAQGGTAQGGSARSLQEVLLSLLLLTSFSGASGYAGARADAGRPRPVSDDRLALTSSWTAVHCHVSRPQYSAPQTDTCHLIIRLESAFFEAKENRVLSAAASGHALKKHELQEVRRCLFLRSNGYVPCVTAGTDMFPCVTTGTDTSPFALTIIIITGGGAAEDRGREAEQHAGGGDALREQVKTRISLLASHMATCLTHCSSPVMIRSSNVSRSVSSLAALTEEVRTMLPLAPATTPVATSVKLLLCCSCSCSYSCSCSRCSLSIISPQDEEGDAEEDLDDIETGIDDALNESFEVRMLLLLLLLLLLVLLVVLLVVLLLLQRLLPLVLTLSLVPTTVGGQSTGQGVGGGAGAAGGQERGAAPRRAYADAARAL